MLHQYAPYTGKFVSCGLKFGYQIYLFYVKKIKIKIYLNNLVW
jgi:hypothetical protein